jgi:hypothetical protein
MRTALRSSASVRGAYPNRAAWRGLPSKA